MARPDEVMQPADSVARIERANRLASGATLLLATVAIAALAVMARAARTDTSVRDLLWWIIVLTGGVVVVSTAVLQRRLDESRYRLMAVARAKTVESEHQRGNAEALQLALLPKGLQAAPGCDVATRYWPAERDTLVGGDFYDAFAIDEHRWGLTIGDVCGHGIGAAALTGVVRHTLRSAARYSFSPADMLRSVHVAITEHDPTMFCTACLIIVMPDASGGAELITALGGHPHPLLSSADGVKQLGSPGTLLGQLKPEFRVTTAVAAPGDILVLYTDGLTDLPGNAAVPLEDIRSVLADNRSATADEVADAIHELKRLRSPEGSRDDTALLVVRFGRP